MANILLKVKHGQIRKRSCISSVDFHGSQKVLSILERETVEDSVSMQLAFHSYISDRCRKPQYLGYC